MHLRRRKARLKARQIGRGASVVFSHAELVAKARSLGCPNFCSGWPTETLIRKIKEKENASS